MEEDKKGKVCREVLKQSCHRVYFELRFLEQAVFRLPPEENERIFFGSDGEKLYFDREYLLNRYLQAPGAVACDCLHTVIHCLYQHPFQTEQGAGEYWNLASDIAVADVLREINVSWITEQIPQECLAIADRIKEEVSMMAAPHIARYLQDAAVREKGLCGYSYAELAGLFRRDSHACWESARKDGGRKSADGEKNGESESDRNKREDHAEGKRPEKNGEAENAEREESEKNRDGESGQKAGTQGGKEEEDVHGVQREEGRTIGMEAGTAEKMAARMQRLSEEWKETAESVALNAGSFAKGQGKAPGSMLLAIQRLTREEYDYADFLKRFAVMNERMKVNMDEFDLSYYLYGLSVLKKVPLIEPLEYREERQIREFVIVLDTSGSCSEELTGRFLNKTYNILSQTACFSDRIVLHIIQCDCEVQEDVRIDSMKHMEEYISDMALRGGGGTDFRPAFAYVEELCRKGEFKRLCGLLYFTDGYGTFPGRPTDYKTAFVFVERDDDVRVPPWAMRVYLDHV